MSKIILDNILKAYGDNTVVEDFNLKIEEGEFVTIIGSSGCGKTTVLKMINGLIEPTRGEIYISNKNIRDIDKVNLRRHIGYVIQGNVLFPHLTVEENINFVLSISDFNDSQIARKLIKLVNLDESFLERMPDELSGGQQQRIGLARALAASPDILLMDEPFGAVDAITRDQLQDEIKNIHETSGLTILFITHDIREALYLSDRIIVMNNGRIEQIGKPNEIIAAPKTDFVKLLTKRVN